MRTRHMRSTDGGSPRGSSATQRTGVADRHEIVTGLHADHSGFRSGPATLQPAHADLDPQNTGAPQQRVEAAYLAPSLLACDYVLTALCDDKVAMSTGG